MIMKHTFLVKEWFGAFLSLLFPRCCVVCGRALAKGEECICAVCNMDLPRTDYHLRRNGLRLFSTIGKGVIFDGYYICLNMGGRKR